ncbi:MAG: hypothetical protein ACOX9C_08715 [Kiritimatiellia bacterium]|jgi:hypothetical protein
MKKTGLMAGFTLLAVAALTGAALAGEGPDRWSLSAGPAWRARVKSSVAGQAGGPSVSASHKITYDKEIAGHGPWSVNDVVVVQDPDFPNNPAFKKYAATRTTTETTVTPGGGAALLSGSDRDRPLGAALAVGYDLYAGERVAAGLSLRVAGYWDMETQASGLAGGGTVRAQSWRDYYLFSDGPYPDETDFTFFHPDSEPYAPYHQDLGATGGRTIPGDQIRARFTSDLYQIGFGPRFTWHVAGWLDVFGAVEALCNVAELEIECGSVRQSDTECLPGAAARLGVAVYLLPNLGLQAEAGYEWVDEAEILLGDAIRGEADYSSLVASGGLALRF